MDKTCKNCKWWDRDGACNNLTWRLNDDHDEDYKNIAHLDVHTLDDSGLDIQFLTPASFGCLNWEGK